MKVGLCDLEFAHIKNPSHYTGYEPPKKVEWVRGTPEQCRVVCFTERCYHRVKEARFKDCLKIAWPLEPPSIHQYAYDDILDKYPDDFDYVFCFAHNYREIFMSHGMRTAFWTPGGSYIHAKDWKIYPKSRGVQIIASKKDWTKGHRLRHEVINKYRKKIDGIYGRAYQGYDYQLEPFKDYRFAIVVENAIIEDYWTDKLLDCFLTGTIPIMWNDGFIESYFNTAGMILWKNIDELGGILDKINDELYNSMMLAIEDNYHRALRYSIVEDFMYETLFKRFDNEHKTIKN